MIWVMVHKVHDHWDAKLPSHAVVVLRDTLRRATATTQVEPLQISALSPTVWFHLNNEALRGNITLLAGEGVRIENGLLDCSWFEDTYDKLNKEFEELLGTRILPH